MMRPDDTDAGSRKKQQKVSAQQTRMLAYMVGGCIFAAGVYSRYYPLTSMVFVFLAPVVPWLQLRLRRWLKLNHPDQVGGAILLSDAAATGFAVAGAHFSLIPSLAFLGILNAYAMGFGNSYLWVLAGFTSLLGGLLGGALFGFDPAPYATTPALMTTVALVGMTCYAGFSAAYVRERSSTLLGAQKKLLEQQEQAVLISRKLAKYLPPQVWESIFSGKRDARLQTHRKKLTIFFSDIKDFTETTDEMSADALTEMINTYFEHMTKIALHYGGTIDKFIGDAILIFFGDPSTKGSKEDALACVSMAIDMRKAMQVLRQKWKSMGVGKPLHVRMGMTTGYCHVGNFGSETRMDYTIIGRDANLASRLQSVASPDEILISHDTYLLVRDRIMCREKGTVTLRGIAKPVQVWEVVDFRSDMGATVSWMEHELEGFAMLMDTNKIKNYDKDRIVKALEAAAQALKDKRID
jgi:class 3 adenylate cyclase